MFVHFKAPQPQPMFLPPPPPQPIVVMPPMPEPYPPSEYTYDDRYDRNLEQELFERDRKQRERLQREMYEMELEHQREHEV